ncbi:MULTISPECIES: A24 family peptidase [Pseudomonas]|uniref:Prepilin peptidase n=1 Tax=Pseudomonas donghuensis TaxID=1163398 RepID=A0AAP0XET5_9PSED|nr:MULTISPECIES: prepilin peptidase [Pseudomonas]MDF9891537.1 prepilin peptidase CpaA [Pseudomonas vranovensis]KDN99678.1 prepilin peptidase [Pseudomonas donghuensis]MBF4206566.1 prepilin peptidase [Pseudomonas donghuensis]MCP6694743.1 prepilin peptidase [Pseudomonas donghuensis]MCP6696452.1 prepilin peptidase [Pseudomonas donghuensis]
MQSIVLLLWLALCSEQDLRERQIANTLTLGAAACALAYLFVTGHTWIGADASEGGWALAIVMLLTLPGYMLGRLGAGDVKLLGALALATDRMHLLGTFIGAGVAVVAWLLGRRWLWSLLSQKVKNRLKQLNEESSKKQPFAPFLLVGFLLAAVWIH